MLTLKKMLMMKIEEKPATRNLQPATRNLQPEP